MMHARMTSQFPTERHYGHLERRRGNVFADKNGNLYQFYMNLIGDRPGIDAVRNFARGLVRDRNGRREWEEQWVNAEWIYEDLFTGETGAAVLLWVGNDRGVTLPHLAYLLDDHIEYITSTVEDPYGSDRSLPPYDDWIAARNEEKRRLAGSTKAATDWYDLERFLVKNPQRKNSSYEDGFSSRASDVDFIVGGARDAGMEIDDRTLQLLATWIAEGSAGVFRPGAMLNWAISAITKYRDGERDMRVVLAPTVN